MIPTAALEDEGWRAFAVCVGLGHLFFDKGSEDEARRLCATCPVWSPCLSEEVEQHSTSKDIAGVRAGTLPVHRRRLRRESGDTFELRGASTEWPEWLDDVRAPAVETRGAA